MSSEDSTINEMRQQMSFLIQLKESIKDLDDRIRVTSLFLARSDITDRHKEIKDWHVLDRPDESAIKGIKDGKDEVYALVRTMSLHGKSGLGGRQFEAMKKNIEKMASEQARYKYIFLLDPWTASIIKENFKPEDISILPLLKEDLASVVRTSGEERGPSSSTSMEPPVQMVEEVITKEQFPEDRTIISPISRTSIRQGFIYIPKERGSLLGQGGIKIWIRKDASIDSKCMISETGGVRIGGNLTKWFKSMGFQQGDELVMGAKSDGSLLVLMIRRATPFRGPKPTVETVKWE